MLRDRKNHRRSSVEWGENASLPPSQPAEPSGVEDSGHRPAPCPRQSSLCLVDRVVASHSPSPLSPGHSPSQGPPPFEATASTLTLHGGPGWQMELIAEAKAHPLPQPLPFFLLSKQYFFSVYHPTHSKKKKKTPQMNYRNF